MSVYDFCYYAMDDSQDVAIWSLDREEEVQSFDISNNVLTLNI